MLDFILLFSQLSRVIDKLQEHLGLYKCSNTKTGVKSCAVRQTPNLNGNATNEKAANPAAFPPQANTNLIMPARGEL